MKILPLISVLLATAVSWSQVGPGCSPIVLLAEIQVHAGDVSLADLLAPGTCPEILHAASKIRIGRAPLAGSPRVMASSEAEGLVSRLPAAVAADRMRVPERLVIRRLGSLTIARDRREPARNWFPSQPRAPLVHRGEVVMLSWEAGGIRLRVPAISLDPGAVGDPVRARLLGSGRILHATVVGPGMLECAS